MAKAENLIGQTFGFLEVIDAAEDRVTPSGQKKKRWFCKCTLCGSHKVVCGQDLKRGTVKSCGCYRAYKGKLQRNIKICVECGKPFECPPSEETVTCSKTCRIIHAQKRQSGVKRSEQTRKKMSVSAQGRDMSALQAIGTKAAKESPNSGRYVTNVNAKDWHLISPEGKHYTFHSLNFWLRENCQELFGCEPDSKEYINALSGLRGAKRAFLGGSYGCVTYKGWRVIPTDSDLKKG
ncbi:hypothetical protein [Enterocloster sp.]|uniref:hypothetical protein n=1 Tax=Enterocloster sp. TaxID=2719315 RepID=UPI003AB50B90